MVIPQGLSAFPLTPADAQGRVNGVEFRRCVSRLVDAHVDSIGILGSTGTHVYLTRKERCRAIDIALEETNGHTPIIAGIGALCTRDVIDHAKDAKAAGVTAGLLPLVSYIPLTEDEAFAHFEAVAAHSALPIIVYNNPITTHFQCSSALIEKLSRVPGIVGIKNITPTPLAEQRATLSADFSVGISGDRIAAEALMGPADTWYSVLGGLLPSLCKDMAEKAQAGNVQQIQAITASLQPIWSMFEQHSGLRVMHAMAHILGIASEPLPLPLKGLSPSLMHDLENVMKGYPEDMLR